LRRDYDLVTDMTMIDQLTEHDRTELLAACRTEVLSGVATSGIGRRSANWPGVGRVRGDFMAFDASRWPCARLSGALRRASG
jgi:hypothetical protein